MSQSKKCIQPLGEYVAVGVKKTQETNRTTRSGLVIPAVSSNKTSSVLCKGIILQLPLMSENATKSKHMEHLHVGQTVFYPDWAGHKIDEFTGNNLEGTFYEGYEEVVLVKAEEIKASMEVK